MNVQQLSPTAVVINASEEQIRLLLARSQLSGLTVNSRPLDEEPLPAPTYNFAAPGNAKGTSAPAGGGDDEPLPAPGYRR
jgi:hypothetical protein